MRVESVLGIVFGEQAAYRLTKYENLAIMFGFQLGSSVVEGQLSYHWGYRSFTGLRRAAYATGS